MAGCCRDTIVHMKSKSTLITLIVAAVIVIGLIGAIIYASSERAKKKETLGTALRPFATCLKDAGAVFYGAFWCPHCQEQKQLFGTAVDALPYVECSLENGKDQTQACIDKKIARYPTWEFHGERVEGVLSLTDLSQRTSMEIVYPAIAKITCHSTIIVNT